MPKHIQPPEVHCPECGVKIALNADGTIPYHTPNGKPSDWKQKCDGVGRKAAKEKVA